MRPQTSPEIQTLHTTAAEASPDTSMRWMLRTASAEVHAMLDARIAPLLASGEEGYLQFLDGSARALLPLEAGLERAGVDTALPDWAERARTEALRQDLADFGVTARGDTAPPAIADEAELFGILYVLEGSRLGAQWLIRQAAAHSSARVRGATRYLAHGQGKHYWGSYLARLEASDAVRRAPQQAIAGASAAFAAFAASFGIAAAAPTVGRADV